MSSLRANFISILYSISKSHGWTVAVTGNGGRMSEILPTILKYIVFTDSWASAKSDSLKTVSQLEGSIRVLRLKMKVGI